MKRILVCGGRDYEDWIAVYCHLDKIAKKRGVSLVIHGAADGADKFAAEWASDRGVKSMPFPVSKEDWAKHGKAAGPLRNARMIREGRPDAVVAFPGGVGTADMIRQARAAGIPVWEPEA